MSQNVTELSVEAQAALFEAAGKIHHLEASVIEKDFWVCWLLEKIFQLPEKMAFKGGTSLSKAYNLISRFSEDIDITIDYRNFIDEINFTNNSKSQIKKIGDSLKEKLKTYLNQKVIPFLSEKINSEISDTNFQLVLSADGESIHFYYPTRLTTLSYYLRDHVLLEFGIRNDTDPHDSINIKTYLSAINNDKINFPVAVVKTLSPIRTFWEKATLIHVECHRNRFTQSPERLSRHWYDLHLLSQSWVGEEALISNGIILSVLEHKKAFFNASYANYDDCLSGKFKLIPDLPGKNALILDFQKMIDARMFIENPPRIEEIMDSLATLENIINYNFNKDNI